MSELKRLSEQLARFSDERDWDRYHTPKNLVMALMNEVGELMEHFQWKTPEQSVDLDEETRLRVRLELADVFIYLVRLADRLDVDLYRAAQDKIAINARKYPPGDSDPERSGGG